MVEIQKIKKIAGMKIWLNIILAIFIGIIYAILVIAQANNTTLIIVMLILLIIHFIIAIFLLYKQFSIGKLYKHNFSKFSAICTIITPLTGYISLLISFFFDIYILIDEHIEKNIIKGEEIIAYNKQNTKYEIPTIEINNITKKTYEIKEFFVVGKINNIKKEGTTFLFEIGNNGYSLNAICWLDKDDHSTMEENRKCLFLGKLKYKNSKNREPIFEVHRIEHL